MGDLLRCLTPTGAGGQWATARARRRGAARAAALLLVVPLALVLWLALPGVASAESVCTDSWVGPAEGEWQTAADWSKGSAPSSSDVACVGSGKTVKVTEGTNQAGVVQGLGALAVSGGRLEVVNSLEPSAIATLSVSGGASVSDGAEVDVTASFSVEGSPWLVGTGSVVLKSGATGTIDSAGGAELNVEHGTLVNEGNLTVSRRGGISGHLGAMLVNSGTLTVNGETVLENHGLVGSGELTNTGTLQKTEGTGVTPIGFSVDNENTVKVTSGQFTFSAGGSSGQRTTGSWSAVGAGTELIFEGGQYSLGTTVPLSGVVRVAAGTVTAGTIEGAAASLSVVRSSCCATSVEVTGATSSMLESLTVSGSYAALKGSGEVDVTHSFTAGGFSSISGSGSLVLKSGATGSVSEGTVTLEGRTLKNEGTLTIGTKAGLIGQRGTQFTNNGTLIVNGESAGENHGLIAGLNGEQYEATFTNYGRVIKTEGTGVTAISFAYREYGSHEARTGSFDIYYPLIVASLDSQYGQLNLSSLADLRFFCGDPVDCVTGNDTETQTDLAAGGRGIELKLTRTYNAQAAAQAASAGSFGYGWSGPFSDHLVVEGANHTATLYQANGSTATFTESGGVFTAPSWSGDTLSGSTEAGYTVTLADQIVFHFNGMSGRLESEADRNGNQTTLSYNEKGQLSGVADPAGRKLVFGYNAEGLVESVTDPMGHVAKYAYEGGNLVSVSLPGEVGPRWRFKYDASHRMTLMIDGRGGETSNTYDSSNRVVSQKDPLGHVLKWEYEPFQTKITNEATGAVTVEQYNSNDMVTSVTRGYGASSAMTTTLAYNERNELTSSTDGSGHTTSYEYDGSGNRIKMLDAEDHETKWTYNGTHDVMSVTRPNGEKTTIERDAHGNPLVVSRPAPNLTTQTYKYAYTTAGLLESMIDPNSRVWKYEYDNQGDRTAEIDPLGDRRTWTYDADSSVISMVSPRGNITGGEPSKYTTKTERDARERPVTVTTPLGHVTKYAYDANGNTESVTDALGHKTTYTYDADNQLVGVKEANGTVTETGYDGAGLVVSQTDGNKHTTKYVRNVLGQVTEVVDPLLHKATKEYDLAGNLKSEKDTAGRTTTYAYDKDSRVTKVSYSDGLTPAVEYEYDQDGNRTSMIDGTGKTTYTYDQLDRLTKTVDGHGDSVGYEYNLSNQPIKLTYPNGKAVTLGYDKAARFEKATDWLEHTTKFFYSQDDEQNATIFPTGTGEEDKYLYNNDDVMNEVRMLKGTETLASLAYTRDNDGQVKAITSKGLPGEEKPSYTYDENNRLTKAGTVAYEYDAADNPTKEGSSLNTFNADDQLEKSASATYAYNEVGQRTKTIPTSGPTTTYGYDQAGNLTTVNRPEEGSNPKIEDTYAYNGDGLRASQTISGKTSYLTWNTSSGLPLLLNDGTSNYVYGPNGIPFEQINATTGAVTYLHHDQAGSTRMLTGTTGTVEATFTYDAYGNQTGHTGAATTPLGYDGQYVNSDTGLVYLRARVYDPTTAQFLSRDPLVVATQEPYSYAADNPTNLGDPTGYEALPLPIESPGGLALCADPVTAALCAGAVGYGAIEAGKALVNAFAGEEGGDEGEQALKELEKQETDCAANTIANGHAFEKHAGEFGTETREGFEEAIKDAIDNATKSKELSNGRTAYYDAESNTVVIVDPSSPDGGTAFKPSGGESYFNRLH